MRRGWKSKVLGVLALGASASVAGVYIPVGAMFVLREAKRMEADRRLDASQKWYERRRRVTAHTTTMAPRIDMTQPGE